MNKHVLGVVASVMIAAAPLVSPAAEALPAPFDGNSILQAEGVVKAIDPAKRAVTVMDANGGEASFTVSDAGNLAQIRKGAMVHVRMTRSARVSPTNNAVDVRSSGRTVSAEVVSLDRASGVLELRGANGTVFHIQGRDPAKVANLQPGMRVEVAYAAQASISVVPAE